ncbi:MAG: glycosyltransferase family 1 protein [Paenibacillaceae bacterium]
MRIALFTDTFHPQVNGVALTLQRLVRYLESKGIEHQLFAPETAEESLPADNINRSLSFPFMFYPECRIALPNIYKIRKRLEAFQPDLIHVATPFNIGLCGLFYGKRHHIPLVASYHTHFDRYLEHYHLQLAGPLFWRYIRWFHQHCIRTFAPSQETLGLLEQQGIGGLRIWNRGVDCSLFHPERRSSKLRERYNIKEPHLFLYVGRLALEKDMDVLTGIMRKLPASISEQVHWLIVGEGPMLNELKATELPRVTFTGYLKGEALAEAYASSNLFVFPSSSETFGNVVLESLAAGLPVVGARSGGVQEIIDHGRNGLLCPAKDTDAFVRSILTLIDNPELLVSMGGEGRRYALTQSWDSIFDSLLDNYRQASTESQMHRSLRIDTA